MISEHMQGISDTHLYLVGAGVLGSYFLALWMNFHYGIYKKTLVPLMFLAGGGMNHLVVMVSRWIFMKDTYGMSSRYALQFQVGILGIFLTFAFVWKMQNARKQNKEESETKRGRAQTQTGKNTWLDITVKMLTLAIAAGILAGNMMTTKAELSKAPYRKIYNLEVKEILLDFENQDDDVLKQKLEYSKPGKKEALRILRDNGLNIFKDN